MDESAEQVPAANIARADLVGSAAAARRWSEAEGAMGSPAVVVLDIGPEGPIQIAPTEDDGPVEALGPPVYSSGDEELSGDLGAGTQITAVAIGAK